MKAPSFITRSRHLLTVGLLPVVSLGCSAARTQMTEAPVKVQQAQSAPSIASISERKSKAATVLEFPSVLDEQNITPAAYQEGEVESTNGEPAMLPPVPDATAFANTGSGLTLHALEAIALQNNPAIQQANAESARAGGIRTQVGLKPNPTVGYNATQLFDAGTDQHTLYVEQTFVRGDKLAWNRAVIDKDLNAMNWQAETQRQRVLTDVRLAFYEALAAQKRLQLATEFQSVAEKGVSISEDRVKAQVGTRPDVLQSEIQLNEVNLTIMQAEFELSAALNSLAALAGVPDLGVSTLIGDLDASDYGRNSEAEFNQIVSRSPQLAAAQARVDRARTNLQRQQIQPISNITAQLAAGRDNGTGQGMVNLDLSMPLPVYNKNQGNITAAHAEYCAATQNVQRIQQSIRRDLAMVMKEYQIAEATVKQYSQSILPKAGETLKLMQEAQQAGEFDFLRVLTARRAYFDANQRYVTALGDLAQANAKLDGLLLTGGLSDVVKFEGDDGLRGQTLSGQ